MKRIFFVTCLLTFAIMVSAQDGQRRGGFQMTPEQRAAYFDQMKKDLNLNDKQFADFKKVSEEYQTKTREAMEKAGDDREARREVMTKLRAEQNDKLKSVLTADQFKKYEEIQAQRMQRGGGGGGNR